MQLGPIATHDTTTEFINRKNTHRSCVVYFVDEEYLVTAFVPSETACFASSPGRIRRTLLQSQQLNFRGQKDEIIRGLNFSR